MKRPWIYILLLVAGACAKQADWEVPENSESMLVVESTLTNEPKKQDVYLHYNIHDLNDEPLPLSGASVIINDEDSTWQLDEDPLSPGKYSSKTNIVARLGQNYSLLILFDEKIYSSQAEMAPGKTFSELLYSKNADDDLYHIDYVASAFESEDPAMWEVLLDWSMVPGYENSDPAETRKRLLFYTLTTLDVSQVFAPVVEDVTFPAGTLIEQKRYSLTPGHADFVRSLLLETSWQGGVFPTDPANVPTNISAGGLGYFGVCAVNSLSLTVNP
ncbi:MAG TPA: DUF4249 family protein [Bacteroidales bacterium]|nr:DUF4249 family protein [Bacteroidales bacterium]